MANQPIETTGLEPQQRDASQREVTTRLSRRAVLRAALGVAGVAALAACGAGTTTPTTAGVPATSTVSGGGAATATGVSGGSTQATATTAAPAPATSTTGAAQATPTAAAARTAVATPVAGSPTPNAAGVTPSSVPGVPSVHAKLPTATTKSVARVPGRGGTVTSFYNISGQPPKPRGENPYWQELEKRLGVRWEPNLVPQSQQTEKFATLTASGDLPDLVQPGYGTGPGIELIAQGAFADLTPYLTGDALKEYPNLAAFPEAAWKNTRYRGKLYRVPRPAPIAENSLIYRADWAEKVGMSSVQFAKFAQHQPRNTDELARMLTAFAKNDPDGNGQADTWGLGGNGPNGFNFTALRFMFRVPQGWRLNQNRSLTADIETEEYRAMLTFARQLWESGAYHPDSPTMTLAQAGTLLDGSKIGGVYNNVQQSRGSRRANLLKATPAARPAALVPMGPDGQKGVVYNNVGFTSSVLIPAKVGQDRERVKELLRILDYLAAPPGSEEWLFLAYGLEGTHYTLEGGLPKTTEALTQQSLYMDRLMEPFPIWISEAVDPNGALYWQQVTEEITPLGIDNPTWPVFSPTAARRSTELGQFVLDFQSDIITGRKPLSALDQAINDWKSRGGDQIRQEFEQELKA